MRRKNKATYGRAQSAYSTANHSPLDPVPLLLLLLYGRYQRRSILSPSIGGRKPIQATPPGRFAKGLSGFLFSSQVRRQNITAALLPKTQQV